MKRNRGKKRLIVNADDFGWSRGTTDGILLAHRDGVVTSTTLMVNQPASVYALEQARKFPELGVGVHLTLCDSSPVLPAAQVPSLVDSEGNFYSGLELKRRLWSGRVSHAEIEAEFRAQIRWAKERGCLPTHADSHRHIHLHPWVCGPFRRALLAEGISCYRSPYRRYWPRNGKLWGGYGGPVGRKFAVAAYIEVVRFRNRVLKSPDSCIDAPLPFQQNPERLGEGWRLLLENIPPGTFELVCHPGKYEPGFSERDKWHVRREAELWILVDPAFCSLIRQNGIQLICYSDLSE